MGAPVGEFGSSGSRDGQFSNPTDVEVTSTGRMFVSDTGNDRIEAFSLDGDFLFAFGTPGSGDSQFAGPTYLGAPWAGNSLYVSDPGNHRVQKFTLDGAFVTAFGSEGSGPGQFEVPSGISSSTDGVLVADAALGRAQAFDAAGNYLSTPLTGLDEPRGMSVDGRFMEAGSGYVNGMNFGPTPGANATQGTALGPLDHPTEGYLGCCYWYVLSDTGNDRLVVWLIGDPVGRTTWGSLKTRY